jgi:hypothetical protein
MVSPQAFTIHFDIPQFRHPHSAIAPAIPDRVLDLP